ncbi:hypothetical protein ROA7450_04067 [Roseovarius albus]|uniref:DUF4399 domain-containing protein n=1 Tax=Roseovarius albus TaxID=1247867 RepID=A0A1X7A7X3_9RHOB|nr:hypothetical protein [Roseovarius albus]SLN72845.1 hypothetical protein ROA7450_04067 [Roseovarius albus]
MQRPFLLLIIGGLLGLGLGLLIAPPGHVHPEAHDHSNPAHHSDGQAHDAMDHSDMDHDAMHDKLTEASAPYPRLTLSLYPDGNNSRNLQIQVEDFTFDARTVNSAHTPGAGHAHIYVNDVKLARTYGEWFHITGLSVGTHDIRVTLNANDHSQLAIDGTPIEATTTVVIE